ncbi:Hypp1165 [Branchiostoma lanceolatum]|uniref:Hypp1165 protein n=1 Tax=Branchiostoma lanceolatum TaxID=7740 RepID=A0A8J9ZEZ5_BRALA|nr:Hypp1165 [Branchiostoma lanceolatum]
MPKSQDTDPVFYSGRLSEKSSGTEGTSNPVYTAGSTGVETNTVSMCYETASSMPKGQDTDPVLYSGRLSEKSPGTEGTSNPVYTAGSTGLETNTVSMCYETASPSIGEEEFEETRFGMMDVQADISAAFDHGGFDNMAQGEGGSKEHGQPSADQGNDDGTKPYATRYHNEPDGSVRDDGDMKPYAVAYMCETDIERSTNQGMDYSIKPYATRYEDKSDDARRDDVDDVMSSSVANMSETEIGEPSHVNQLRPNPMYAPNDRGHARAAGRRSRWACYGAITILITIGIWAFFTGIYFMGEKTLPTVLPTESYEELTTAKVETTFFCHMFMCTFNCGCDGGVGDVGSFPPLD